jgi:hypothetical protein
MPKHSDCVDGDRAEFQPPQWSAVTAARMEAGKRIGDVSAARRTLWQIDDGLTALRYAGAKHP